jgi:hypothetical protein
MTEQLPAIIDRTKILGDARAHIVPPPPASALAPFPGIFCSEYPQSGLRPRCGGVHGLVRRQPGAVDHGRAAASRRGLDRAADAHACGTHSQTTPAALRHLFDWLVTGQETPTNPARSVRGPSHVVKASKTLVLAPEEPRALINSMRITTPPACATAR